MFLKYKEECGKIMLTRNLPIYTKKFINCFLDMSEREKNVLVERFVNNKSLLDVANSLGISEERVRQVENRAIKHIEFVFNTSTSNNRKNKSNRM